MIETGNFRSTDGIQLFYRAPPPKVGAKPVLVIHGFAEHSGRYGEILTELESSGFAPIAFDLRGHGHSDGKRGHINEFQDYVNDVKAAVDFVKQRHGDQAVILLAHSMGALIATHYAIAQPESVCGLVLSSPLFGIHVQVPPWKKELGHWMSKLWPSFGLPNNIDANELTHDEVKAEVYRSDPLIFHHVTARWFEEIVAVTDKSLETASELNRPFLLQLSDEDRIVSYEKSCEWYEKNVVSDKSLRVYSGFFHEIYNEQNRRLPFRDFIDWMSKRWPQGKVEETGPRSGNEKVDPKQYGAGANS